MYDTMFERVSHIFSKNFNHFKLLFCFVDNLLIANGGYILPTEVTVI